MTTTLISPEQASSAAPAPTKRKKRRDGTPLVLLLPALIMLVVFIGWPLFQLIIMSFQKYGREQIFGAPPSFVGFDNFVTVFQDEGLRLSFVHAGVLMLFYAVLPVVGALLLTALISRAHRMRSMSFYRTVLFLPQVIASVVVGTIWVSIYSQTGLVNQVLRAVGLGSLARVWLGEYDTALIAIGLVGTWLNIGLCLVLFLSGVGNIPPELFEAARIDGAGRIREFFAITLPSLRGQISVGLTLTVVSALKTFDIVYITTRGGPGTSTAVPAYEAYNRAFNTGQVGLAAAVALVLTVVIVAATVLIGRLEPKDEA